MKYITSTPNIMGGAPVITGTRIPIVIVLSLLKQGYTVEAIADMYSWVSVEKIEGAITELIERLSDSDYAATLL